MEEVAVAPVELLVLGHDLGGEGQLVHELAIGQVAEPLAERRQQRVVRSSLRRELEKALARDAARIDLERVLVVARVPAAPYVDARRAQEAAERGLHASGTLPPRLYERETKRVTGAGQLQYS